jgi:beta-lactamase regulating signal transducer with metallopeptidase domain
MNHLAFDSAFVQRIAGTLLHFVWQGAAIAGITAICLRLMSRASAEARYLVSVSGLASMLAAPVVTFVLYDRIGDVTLRALILISDGHTASAVEASPVLMYWIVGLWSAGVLGYIGRLIVAWHFSCRLLRTATHQVPVEVVTIFQHTAAVLGIDVIRKRVRLLISGAVDSPAVVGWIRPVILVPVSALTGLTNEQLMAVLAHELAHIRRHDFLVNTLQTGVESLLFYHPAVWWMSGRVRAERENCCDDLAVRVCGNPRLYVQALVDLERARPRVDALAVSAAGGSLKERVRRLLGFKTSTVDWRSVLVTFVFVCVWIVAGLWQSALSESASAVPQSRQGQATQLAAVLPELPPSSAATVVSTVAAIATAQPVVSEAQLPQQPGVVTGIFRTNTGAAMDGVHIAIIPADQSIPNSALERLGLTGLTDIAGRYRLENISTGRYNILVGRKNPPIYHPGVADLGRATTIQVVGGSTIEVPDMVVSGAIVAGRLVDMETGNGRRVENLVLCCDYFKQVMANGGFFGPRIGSPLTAVVSDDGSFVFPSVPPGNYVLSTVDSHVIPVSWALAVGPNGVTALRLDIAEGVEVQGTVLDQTGMPVSASVELRPKPANSVFITSGPRLASNPSKEGSRLVLQQPLIPKVDPSLDGIQDWFLEMAKRLVRSDTTAPDGRFVFRSVYPGTYMLEVKSGGVTLPAREIQVGIAGLTSLSFQVTAIQVTGRVVASGSGPLPKLNYIRLVRSGSDTDIFYGFPDREGNFSLALVPGAYRVFTERLGLPVQSVSDGSRDITNTEVTFEAGRNPRIVVTLEP